MSILFVLLTFLIVIVASYYFRREHQPAAVKAESRPWLVPLTPSMMKEQGFDIPKDYCFHPGHTWVLDEGHENARIGIDSLASHLLGSVDRVELVGLNRWVRQGQKVCTLVADGMPVDVLSPVEGVVLSVNREALRDPGLIAKDPYRTGWICVVKAPELATNTRNLIRGSLVTAWMQNSLRRLGTLTSQLAPAMAADGGLPVAGLLSKLEPTVQRSVIQEFFLT